MFAIYSLSPPPQSSENVICAFSIECVEGSELLLLVMVAVVLLVHPCFLHPVQDIPSNSLLCFSLIT